MKTLRCLSQENEDKPVYISLEQKSILACLRRLLTGDGGDEIPCEWIILILIDRNKISDELNHNCYLQLLFISGKIVLSIF